MKKILVPCDFSDSAQEAFKFALEIAAISNGEIHVARAIDMPITYESAFGVQPYVMNPALIKELEDDSKGKFEKMKALYPVENRLVSFHIVHGSVTPAITQFIKNEKTDLVIMGTQGTHGTSGLEEIFFGSNTEKIVRFSPVPVFAIRKAPNVSSIKNILLPSTLDLGQSDFVNAVKDLQNFFSATLHIFLVNMPARFKEYSEAQEALRQYADHYQFKDYTLNVRNNISEEDGILNFSQEINPDMIAMATHSRQGLAHLFSGSVTEDVVNHARFPIWTYSLKMSKEEY
jgi:nucleotide-binding universal stress UspA family protein